MFILFLFLLMPLAEIAGFIVIGGKIGLGLSLLWVVADVVVGAYILSSIGTRALRNVKNGGDGLAGLEDVFVSICTLGGAFLLIFPGFISDLLAAPLLLPPLRRALFFFLGRHYKSVLSGVGKNAQGFTYWYYGEKTGDGAQTIEGSFTRTDDINRLQ